MSTNPFKPPETDSTKNPLPSAGPGSMHKAVLMGLAVDIGGSLVVGSFVAVMYAAQLHGDGLSENEMREATMHMRHDTALYVAGLLGGLLMSTLGGFVCARVARRGEARPGLVMAACSGLFGLMLGTSAEGDGMLWLLTITSIACNLLGVKFGADHNRRTEAAADRGKDAPTP